MGTVISLVESAAPGSTATAAMAAAPAASATASSASYSAGAAWTAVVTASGSTNSRLTSSSLSPQTAARPRQKLLVELGALLHHVDGLVREHPDVHADVAARLGRNAHAGGGAGAVGLHDVGGLGRNGRARDGDDPAIDGGDLDGLDAAGEERAQQRHHKARGSNAEADLKGHPVPVDDHEGACHISPGAGPGEAQRRQREDARERPDCQAQAFETTHDYPLP